MIGEHISGTFRGIESYAEATLNETTVRVAVTGLSRAGKTVFLTSLIHNLLAMGRNLNTLPALRNHLEAAAGKPAAQHSRLRRWRVRYPALRLRREARQPGIGNTGLAREHR